MSDQFFWYATRAAGLACWFAACASVVAGLLISTRALGPRPSIPWLTDLHRYLGGMAMTFLAIHMITLWADTFVTFSWRELLIPGVATVPGLSRLGLALGVVAAWIMAAVHASSLIRDRLPSIVWHRIHLGSFAVVVLGTIHGWTTGSDVGNVLIVATGTSVLAGTGLLTFVRVNRHLTERKRRYDAALAPQRRAR